MSTDAEKLQKIAALCDESERDAADAGDSLPYLPVQYVRAVLAEPGPAVPAQGTVIHEEPGQYRIDRWVDDDGPAVPAHDEGDSVPALVLNRQAAWRVISDAIERDRKRQPVMGLAVLDDLEDCVAIPRCEHGITLSDLCRYAADQANAEPPAPAAPPASEVVEFTVDLELLDRHAIELAARTRLPLDDTRESLLRLVDVLRPAVRPATDIVLNNEEAHLALLGLFEYLDNYIGVTDDAELDMMRALAARLEASL